MSFELVFYLVCVSAYPLISHVEPAVEIMLPCNTKWLYFLAWCHNARSALYLTTVSVVKWSVISCLMPCPRRTIPLFDLFNMTQKNGGVLHLKIIFAHLWKKHGDPHLLTEKPWGSSACSWLILLDIRHCLFKLHNILIPPCTDCFLVLSVWICCHASSCMHIEQWSQVTLIADSILWFGMSLLYSGSAKKEWC